MDNETRTAQVNAWLTAWVAETNNAHVVNHLTELLAANLKTDEAAEYCEKKLYSPTVGKLYTDFLYWVADQQKQAREKAAESAGKNNNQFAAAKSGEDAEDPLTRLGDLLYQQSELSSKISATIFEVADSIKKGQ